jgi:16S rRNA (cytosine967-C5)-methyltransferase
MRLMDGQEPERDHMIPMTTGGASRIRVAGKQAELAAGLLVELDTAVGAGRPADRMLAGIFHRHREWGSRDRRFFSELVFSFFRWRGWVAPDPIHGSRGWFRAGAAAWLLDAETMHPAVAAMLEAADVPTGRLSPAGGLSLADKAKCLAAWDLSARTPTPSELAPAWMAGELEITPDMDPAEAVQAWLFWLQTRPPVWLRLRTGRESLVLAALATAGLTARRHPTASAAVRLHPGANLEALPGQVRAGFEIQDLHSQAVGLAAAPRPGERWWDLCAGSGGKALHLADLAGGHISLLATDIREAAVAELRRRLRRTGVAGVEARTWDGRSAPAGLFDGILVDAPCTGSGTWHRNPDGRWRTSPAALEEAVSRQERLLAFAAAHVRPGGRLIYATCSVFRRENSGLIRAFLASHPAFRLEPGLHPFTGAATDGTVYFPPGPGGGNGMFLCRFRKIGD